MQIELSVPSMGIGAAIAAAIILVPFFIIYLQTDSPASDTSITGIPTNAALDPPPPKPSIELLISNASSPLGNIDAPITLVEFGDYQCGFCHRYFVQTEPAIISQYVDTGLVKILFKDFIIIGPDSITAAHAAQCGGEQDLFWEFHDAIYQSFKGERTGWASNQAMSQIASMINGLDEQQWIECMNEQKYINTINASSSDARTLGLDGTPAFYLISQDGQIELLRGAKPLAEFQATINSMIAG